MISVSCFWFSGSGCSMASTRTSTGPSQSRSCLPPSRTIPIGCVVRLSDQSVGVVCRPGDNPLAPIIKITYDSRGTELEDPPQVDLADGTVRIVEIVPEDALNIEVSDSL